MKKEYCRPAVYRWMVWTPGSRIHAYYVGETENLARRIQHCLRPGNSQATNIRLKAYFEKAVNQKQRVELQTLVFEPFQVNKVNFSMELLGHTHIRRILENLVLVWLDAEKLSGSPLILNRVLEQEQRAKQQTHRHSSRPSQAAWVNGRADQPPDGNVEDCTGIAVPAWPAW